MTAPYSEVPSRNPAIVRLLFWFGRRRLKVPFRVLCMALGIDLQPGDYTGVIIPHPIGIVIHSTAKFGRGVIVYQNVSIASSPRARQAATIGDGVLLGAGSVIIGPVTIGAGAKVGANAVVTRDVPPGAVVVGAPAREVVRQTQ